jgi:hypothetical protein
MSKEKSSAKTDAMRKAREEQWARSQSVSRRIPPDPPSGVGSLDNETHEPRATPRKVATPTRASGAPARSEAPARTAEKSSRFAEAEARCTGCGKIRAVRNGKIAAHMKGLKGQCPGAGKAP